MTDHHYALVTGANSGLGFAICCRLIDEAYPTYKSLTIIFTTRSSKKAADTLKGLQKHYHGVASERKAAISFQPEILDLTRLKSVKALADRLQESVPKIDSLFLNAGIGAFVGINWFQVAKPILTGLVSAVTWPTYNLSYSGSVTNLQLTNPEQGSGGGQAETERREPPIGEVFCANVFGHYMLSHFLVPLLGAPDSLGRIIWISSLEGLDDSFSTADFQFLRNATPYRASKRLTDLLALTVDLPSTRPWVDRYLAPPESSGEAQKAKSTPKRPKTYLAHPGICSTEIMSLNFVVHYGKLLLFYVARLCGSPWHTITPYAGAVSAVWLGFSPQSRLDNIEAESGVGKWGSATDAWGDDRVIRTQVDGWGYGGRVGDDKAGRKGRRKEAAVLTQESREEFEEAGRECWKQMEALREDWERLLADQ